MVNNDELPEEFKSLLDKLGGQLGSEMQENKEKLKSLAKGAKTKIVFGILLQSDENTIPVSVEVADDYNGLIEILKIITMFAISSINNKGNVKDGIGGIALTACITTIEALSLAFNLDAPLSILDSLDGMNNLKET